MDFGEDVIWMGSTHTHGAVPTVGVIMLLKLMFKITLSFISQSDIEQEFIQAAIKECVRVYVES